MKRVVVLLLAFALILSMAACSKKNQVAAGNGATGSGSASGGQNSAGAEDSGNGGDEAGSSEGNGGIGGAEGGDTVPDDPNHTHIYSASEATSATCAESGTKTLVCSCGSVRTEKIPAVGHLWGAWKILKEATTTEQGLNQRTCTRCNTAETLAMPKLTVGHTHEYKTSVIREADCLNFGEKKFTCACGLFYTNTIPATGHSYADKVTKDASCEENGIKSFTCACGASYTEVIAALGHSWGDWVTAKEPTTTEDGAEKRTCSACSKEEEKTLPKLPSAESEQLTISDEVLGRIKTEFLRLVNLERSGKQLNELTLNGELDRVAAIRGDEIQESFSHTRPNGELYYSLVDESAYPYVIVGENICMTSHVGSGSYTAADQWVASDAQIEAVAAWTFVLFKNSPGHYANMIHEEYQECGIGISYKVEDGIPYFYTAHIFGAR